MRYFFSLSLSLLCLTYPSSWSVGFLFCLFFCFVCYSLVYSFLSLFLGFFFASLVPNFLFIACVCLTLIEVNSLLSISPSNVERFLLSTGCVVLYISILPCLCVILLILSLLELFCCSFCLLCGPLGCTWTVSLCVLMLHLFYLFLFIICCVQLEKYLYSFTQWTRVHLR